MTYLLESSVLLILFYLAYILLKSNITVRTRRFLLLSIMLSVIVIPVLEIDLMFERNSVSYFPEPVPADLITIDNPGFSVEPSQKELPGVSPISNELVTSTFEINPFSVAAFMYLGVMTLLLIRLLFGVWSILQLKSSSRVISDKDTTYYELTNNKMLGASFFKLIFLSENIGSSSHRDIILFHEKTHADFWHSMDIILVECYCCVFWFNPVSWFLKEEIGLVIEYEADERTSLQFGVDEYSKALVELTVEQRSSTLIQPFAQKSIHKRVLNLGQAGSKRRWYTIPTAVLTFLVGLYFFGCRNSEDIFLNDYSGQDPHNVKKITTTYISHQSDTQQKDGQVIAIANFTTEGELEDLTEYTSYPYDHKEPVKHSFMATPLSKNLPHFMDGLDMKSAENNLLYGNDWPIIYMNSSHTMEPRLRRMFETDSYKRDITTNENNYPVRVFEGIRSQDGTIQDGYLKEFEFLKTKIKRYSETMLMSVQFLEGIRVDAPPGFKETGIRNVIIDRTFEYDGDLLTSIKTKKRETKFTYQGDWIKSSEYYIKEKLFNRRIYYYNDFGLKTKTDIYNVNNEPEYTIYYQYEFW